MRWFSIIGSWVRVGTEPKATEGQTETPRCDRSRVSAAIAYATCPANAAKMSAGCSGENLCNTESTVETMADGDAKIAAQKEISAAQDAMLAGKMGACAAHIGKAMHAVGAK